MQEDSFTMSFFLTQDFLHLLARDVALRDPADLHPHPVRHLGQPQADGLRRRGLSRLGQPRGLDGILCLCLLYPAGHDLQARSHPRNLETGEEEGSLIWYLYIYNEMTILELNYSEP